MGRKNVLCAAKALALGIALVSHCLAAPPNLDSATEAVDKLIGIGELRVRVVDPDGHPVAHAKVAPWALRSSQGHGVWHKDDTYCDLVPADTWTDTTGITTVAYPYYRFREEQIRTTEVTLEVDHPEFAYVSDVYVEVPVTTQEPHEIRLPPGVPVEVRPVLNGEVANHDNLFTICSDGRSFNRGFIPRISADGTVGIAALRPGANSLLLVLLDGDRATHFSRITDFNLAVGEPKQLDVELRAGVCVRGTLKQNVPRPVRKGRVSARTLHPADAVIHRVEWETWVPIQPDGTFIIDSWPANEPIQLIALCEGFIAANGIAPEEVKNPPQPSADGYGRPQVFRPSKDGIIELAMHPLVRCNVTAVDEDDKPVAGVEVAACPNVRWWNNGSQIYCHWLVRGERLVRVRDSDDCLDNVFSKPFFASTEAHGRATLELPSGNESLEILSDVYELPVVLGRREVDVGLPAGKPTEVTLRLQPRGTEKLGEWDKLAGVVFGI